MLIVCPSCATSYQVEPTAVGENGRSVRCARCRNVWFATPTVLIPAVAGVDQWDDIVDTGPRVPSVDNGPVVTAAAADFAPPPGIDVDGLGAEMAGTKAEQEAAADAVLAEITGETPAAQSPPLVPGEGPTSLDGQPAAEPDPSVLHDFAARQARRKAARRGSGLKVGLPAAIAALIVVHVSLIAARADIVRLLPQTAEIYAAIGLPVNLRGLVFHNVRMSRSMQDGVAVVVVEGAIVNPTGRPIEIPRMRLSMRNDAKQEIYAWTAQAPGRSILQGGEATPFRTRLASPPREARELQVRFVNKRDVQMGLN
jgi:predicted Zn finger-like uncharacterized protein